MLEKLIKSGDDFLNLKHQMQSGKLSSSLLFSCKDQIFALELCKQVAALIFDGAACGKCEDCLKIAANAHPDLKIYPEKDKLVVAESEEIVMESFIKPIFARSKVFIIQNIDQAADVAQNKLLKILEEPPQNVYFLLTCSSQDKVLPTIRSRCQKYELARVDDKTILSLLPEIDQETRENIVAVCDGQIGKALSLSKKNDFSQICQDCVSVFVKMKSSKQVLTFSKKLQQHADELSLCLQIMAIACGDLFKIKAGKSELVRLKNFQDDFERVSDEYTLRALCEISGLLDQVQKERSFNVNLTLALENFLLNLLEVKYLCK